MVLLPAFFYFFSVTLALSQDTAPVARLDSGIWQGFRRRNQEVFLGIPFARPPVGNLRFRPSIVLTGPLPISNEPSSYSYYNRTIVGTDSFTKKPIFDATHYAPSCLQTGFAPDPTLPSPKDQSEDCKLGLSYLLNAAGAKILVGLTINIFSPVDTDAIKNLKPILVWIYGAGYQAGTASSDLTDGSYFIQESIKMVRPLPSFQHLLYSRAFSVGFSYNVRLHQLSK